jgi:hypothetical protein
MRKKSAIEPTLTACGGRIGDTHVPWVQDMAGTCPRFAFWIYLFICLFIYSVICLSIYLFILLPLSFLLFVDFLL